MTTPATMAATGVGFLLSADCEAAGCEAVGWVTLVEVLVVGDSTPSSKLLPWSISNRLVID
jgi:hypothetical protein